MEKQIKKNNSGNDYSHTHVGVLYKGEDIQSFLEPELHLTLDRTITKIEGKVLTIMDAVFSDKGQNKAVKDMVREAVRNVADKQFESFYNIFCEFFQNAKNNN